MKNEEKLDIILDYFNIKNNSVAKTLEVSPSLVSQWRNKNANKLNKLHIYALSKAFGMPLDIFEDKDIDSKEKLLKKLNSCCNVTHNECIFKKSIPSKLIGRWYCYSYKTNGDFNINLIDIKRYEVKVYDSEGEITYSGYPMVINDYQTLLVLSKKDKPHSVQITINNDLIDNSLFYASTSLRTFASSDFLMFCLFSKEAINRYVAIDILREKNKNLLPINEETIKNIQEYKTNKEYFLNRKNSLKNTMGKWYLYFNDQESENQISIDENLRASWFKNGDFYKYGEVITDKDAIILKFDNNNYHSIYFMFNIDNIEIKLIYYIGQKYITNHNIFSVGIMSKKELDGKTVKSILKDSNNILNLTKIYRSLAAYLNK